MSRNLKDNVLCVRVCFPVFHGLLDWFLLAPTLSYGKGKLPHKRQTKINCAVKVLTAEKFKSCPSFHCLVLVSPKEVCVLVYLRPAPCTPAPARPAWNFPTVVVLNPLQAHCKCHFPKLAIYLSNFVEEVSEVPPLLK